MREITAENYYKISKDYKGTYSDFDGTMPEWKGKRTLLGWDDKKGTCLFIEDVNLKIIGRYTPTPYEQYIQK